MKVSLVVASGVHEGRTIPLSGPQFLIGRDPQCHLRPASQAISKVHCAVLVRDGQVYVKDFGSTNGTLVNNTLVQGTEVPVADGASVRLGPLDFRVKVEAAARSDGTPLPADTPEAAAAIAAARAAVAPAAPRDATPAPTKPGGAKPIAKPAEQPGMKDATPLTATSESASAEDHDRIAAMLLGMDEGGNASVPDGSTVMDIPSPLGAAAGTGTGEAAKPDEKKDDKPKKAQTREEMSNAASDLLRQMMRRPK